MEFQFAASINYRKRVRRALIETLEGRELLSTSLPPWQVTLAPSASARHAHHVHHLNHLRHLRHMNGVSRAIAPNIIANAAAAAAPIVRPDHIVVVIEEDRASGAIGDIAPHALLQPVGSIRPRLYQFPRRRPSQLFPITSRSIPGPPKASRQRQQPHLHRAESRPNHSTPPC